MNRIFVDIHTGKKNIVFGIGLFIALGILVGIPLTIDFFGGSLLKVEQYQVWKVVHGYGVFLAFINYFFGLTVDRLNAVREQKEIASWAFVLAGLAGGLGRMVLVLFSALGTWGLAVSLAETVLFILGTVIVVRSQLAARPGEAPQPSPAGRYSPAK